MELSTDRPNIGERVGRYVVLEELGAGAMGVVLRGYDARMRREVALKLIRLQAGIDFAEARARQLREARALASVSHPHVVSVYDAEPSDRGVVIIMEFVRGRTLRAWLSERERSWAEIVAVGLACGEGLGALHARGLVHRDVKPDNILVGDDDDRVRIADFGLVLGDDPLTHAPTGNATIADPMPMDSVRTATGVAMGTPAYMAPEQHTGSPAGPAADQYALCLMLWEALHGARPFKGSSMEELARRKREGPPARPPTAVPGWLHVALARGLAPQPADRWPNVEALCNALRFTQRSLQRRRVAIGLATVAALAVGLAAGHAWQQRRTIAGCEDEGRALVEGLWSPPKRQSLHDSLVAEYPERGEALFAKAEGNVDALAEALQSLQTTSCIETKLHERRSEEELAEIGTCLFRVREETAARLELFDEGVDGILEVVAPLTDALGEPRRCLTPEPRDAGQHMASNRELVRLNIYATVSINMGRLEEAEAYAGEMEDLAEAAGSDRDRFIARSLRSQIHLLDEDPTEAALQLRESFVELGASGNDRLAMHVSAPLAITVGHRMADPEAALVYLDAAKVLAGPEVARLQPTAWSRFLDALGIVQMRRGALVQSIETHRESLAIVERELGPDTAGVATVLVNLSTSLFFAEDFSQAVAMMERALRIRTTLLGPSHREVLMTRSNLAMMLENVGRTEEAEQEYRALLPEIEAQFGANDFRLIAGNMMLAHFLSDRGEYDAALPYAQRALEVAKVVLGPENPGVVDHMADLGRILWEQGKPGEAIRILRDAVALGERVMGSDRSLLANPIDALGQIAFEEGRFDDAVALFERGEAERSTAQLLPTDHAQGRYMLARALWEAGGDRARALSLARQAEGALSDPFYAEAQAEIRAWIAAHTEETPP